MDRIEYLCLPISGSANEKFELEENFFKCTCTDLQLARITRMARKNDLHDPESHR